VPQHPVLFGSLDALEHRRRYTAEGLEAALTAAGFRVDWVSVPGWWLTGNALRRKTFSLETAQPVLRRIDRWWPWCGLSLIGVAVSD
jgi:hypothetical protein